MDINFYILSSLGFLFTLRQKAQATLEKGQKTIHVSIDSLQSRQKVNFDSVKHEV